MSIYPCPKNGCESTDPTWCSECGAQMQPGAIPAPASPAALPAATSVVCPDCGTPRDGTDEYCGICRYNFTTCKSYQAAPPAPTASPSLSSASVDIANTAAAIVAPSPVATPAAVGEPNGAWCIVIDFDPTIDPTIDAAAITPHPQLTFPLDLPELAIGRKSSKYHPEIPIDDEGVSSRHARIFFTPDGAPMIIDQNSTNGTVVNDQPITPGLATPLSPGATIKIGRWTRITVYARVTINAH